MARIFSINYARTIRSIMVVIIMRNARTIHSIMGVIIMRKCSMYREI